MMKLFLFIFFRIWEFLGVWTARQLAWWGRGFVGWIGQKLKAMEKERGLGDEGKANLSLVVDSGLVGS